MNRKFFLLLVLLISYEFAFTQNLLKGPQKIVIDAKRNRLLVSNYDSGDIVQIDSNGKQSYFYQNAGFVDGIEIVGDIVYGVGSNRKILGYDLRKPHKVFDINIPGDPEQYLSSICSDSNGHLFVSCPKLNAIYRIRLSDGAYSVFAKGNGLNRPNGILLENEKNRIVVIDDSPAPSLIHSISLIDSTVTTLKSTAFDRPDGIVRDKLGNYFIGGYYLQGLYKINSDFNGDFELFYKGNNIVYPTYDSRNNSLLVTFYNSNSWEKIPLPATHVENDLIKTTGPFMGQAFPDTSLQLFAPGLVSTGLDEGVITSAPDGKYLYFQGIAATSITDSLDRKYTLEELIDLDVKSPQKGSTDIYWISTKIIEELRLKENKK